jgi:hypothetical protein
LIEFRCRNRRAKSRTPVISDVEIESWAEAVLQDYKPSHLREPGALNAIYFVENYLEATIDYQDIYYPEGETAIIGATAFNDEYLRVFDRERKCIREIAVSPRTVILDNSIMADDKKGLCSFTVLHEGGHLFIHPEVYTRPDTDQISLFDGMTSTSRVVCCRRNTIESGVTGSATWTEEDFREHHANVFAAAIAMPKRTFIPYVRDVIRAHGFKAGYIVAGDWEVDDFDVPCIASEVAKTYGVSKSAALVNMKKRGLYLDGKPMQLAVGFGVELPF